MWRLAVISLCLDVYRLRLSTLHGHVVRIQPISSRSIGLIDLNIVPIALMHLLFYYVHSLVVVLFIRCLPNIAYL